MSSNFSLDPLTTESELKRVHKENSSFSTSHTKKVSSHVFMAAYKELFGNFGKMASFSESNWSFYLHFVKLGFVGSVSFIC